MRQDDEDFSRKSKTYRKNYVKCVSALYGTDACPALKPPKKPKVKRNRIDPYGEAAIQIKLVQWARNKGLTLISIPNHGKRSYWTGQKEVAMGLTRGVSDLFLAHPRRELGGFWIELKSPGREPTVDQYQWLWLMDKLGYKAAWFDDFDIAKNAIIEYLNLI